MSGKRHSVSEVARIAGVTVRTLHHYDAIGLLSPTTRSPTGYRWYSGADLERLHQILVWREVGLPLEEIRRLLDDGSFDRRAALEQQREQLSSGIGRAQVMLRGIDAALAAMKGDRKMSREELFEGWQDEARHRWGGTAAYLESARRTASYGKPEMQRIQAEADGLMAQMARLMQSGGDPRAREATGVAERHRLHIDRWFYPCTRDWHAGLAEMYVTDERFREGFEKHGEGLAAFFAEAIRANLDRGMDDGGT